MHPSMSILSFGVKREKDGSWSVMRWLDGNRQRLYTGKSRGVTKLTARQY